ncbi:MAG: NAD(P)H-hydrate dehydratase [Dehalococcoidia bacterium]|jgi:NAD(P)H-hydrate epimerase
MKLVTADQVRSLDQQATKGGVPVEKLMENAGRGVAEQVRALLGTVKGRRIVVLAGPGNNGGDGLVAARYLHDWGAEVRVYLLAQRRADDANLPELVKREIDITDAESDPSFAALDRFLSDAELIVDALLGTGRARPIEANLAQILERVRRARSQPQPPRLVAVDLPTGVNSDTGAVDPHALPTDLTVTLGYSKIGLHTLPGSQYAGDVEVVDIGLPDGAENSLKVELMTDEWVAGLLPQRPLDSNKGTFGRVLVVAGSENYIGAVHLAAVAAGRAGAGLVTVACPLSIHPIVAAGLVEATYLPLPDKEGGLSERGVADVLRVLEGYDVMLIGPGLGGRSRTLEFVRSLLFELKEGTPTATVVDADALNTLGGVPGWAARMNAPLVLTPHPGELRRLSGKSIAEIQSDRLAAAMQSAVAWRQVVVLKGAHTVVATPDGRAAVSPFANPALASAGTGDVLSGTIAGLLAQGLDRFAAASCGVYLHGMAGERIREAQGDAGLQASDLLPELPRAIHALKSRAR